MPAPYSPTIFRTSPSSSPTHGSHTCGNSCWGGGGIPLEEETPNLQPQCRKDFHIMEYFVDSKILVKELTELNRCSKLMTPISPHHMYMRYIDGIWYRSISDSISWSILLFPLFFGFGKESFLPSFSFFESIFTGWYIPFRGFNKIDIYVAQIWTWLMQEAYNPVVRSL